MIPKSTGLDRPTEPMHPLASPSLEGGRNALKAEIGATLERQLLLAGEPEDEARSPVLAPWVSRLILSTLLLAAVASGVFFFIQSRRTWEGKVAGLEEDLRNLAERGVERERVLLEQQAAKDQEIAERKAETERIVALADDTLRQLHTSLEDFRKLREEKVALEREYLETLRKERASFAGFLDRWVPKWARPDGSRQTASEPTSPHPVGPPSTES